MATAAAPLERRVDVVVSVPLHPKRLAERGFDQSALLARSVAQRLLVPWAPRALARTRETAQQASLDRDARAENVASAFRCRDAESVVGRRVLLIDDVRTTGSTLSACIRALRIAGARSVNTMVLARRDRDEPTDAPAALGAELRPPKETSIVV
jgi:ComF family protein